MKNILLSVLTFCSMSMSAFAGTWVYPVSTDYGRGEDGIFCYVHKYSIYGNIQIVTIDSGERKGGQAVFDNNGNMISSKLGPDFNQVVDGYTYAVYNHNDDYVYHDGQVQAIYLH